MMSQETMQPSPVQGVELTADEEVEWIWTHTNAASYVSGYSIIARSTTKVAAASTQINTNQLRPTARRMDPNWIPRN